MKKIIISLLFFSVLQAPAQEHAPTPSTHPGVAASHGAYDTVALSMILWGTGMAVGIALLSGLLDFSTSDGNNGGGGSNGHAHGN